MQTKIYYIVNVLLLIFLAISCDKKDSFPGATASPYIAIFDIRSLWHNNSNSIILSSDRLGGADSIMGIVVSDHSSGNLSDSLLIVQDSRRLSMLRGIAINIVNASNYTIGDSIAINIKDGTLTQKDGILQIVNVKNPGIRKIATNVPIAVNRVASTTILANPDIYESTQVSIVKGGPNPLPSSSLPLSGTIVLNDGFGNIDLVTKSTSKFADSTTPVLGNFTGIVMNKINVDNTKTAYLTLRNHNDITTLSSTISNTPIVISGFLANPSGDDGNYEYIQCLATQDIDFTVTPYAIVTCNNAGTSKPTGVPSSGWATGSARTYKMNITTGLVKKGTFFYVGGTNNNMDGKGSATASSSIWYGYNYSTLAGQDFGSATSNLLANSGNAAGIAIFKGTKVLESTEPIDVVFISNGGNLYSASPAKGYRITNTDIYDKIDPISLTSQPYYLSGSNTLYTASHAPSTVSDPFFKLGGIFNTSLGRWISVRQNVYVSMTGVSNIKILEDSTATKLSN